MWRRGQAFPVNLLAHQGCIKNNKAIFWHKNACEKLQSFKNILLMMMFELAISRSKPYTLSST
jgi:hypothetical protein